MEKEVTEEKNIVADNQVLGQNAMEYILNSAHIAYWEWNISTNEYTFSNSFYELYGYRPGDENLSVKLEEMILPGERKLVFQAYSDHINSKGEIPYEFQVHYRHRNGEILFIWVRGEVVKWDDSGNPLKMIGTHANITKLKHITSGNSELLAKGINAGIWEWRIKDDASWWSDRFYELLKYSRQDLHPSYESLIKLMHPSDQEEFHKQLNEYLANNGSLHLELRLKTKAGQYLWFELYGCAEWDEHGNANHLVCSLIGINERKNAEEELRHYGFLMHEAGKMAKAGAWEMDLQTMKPVLSEEVYQILDLPLDHEFSKDEGGKYYHPEYRDMVRKQMRLAVEEGRPWDVECKFITAKKKEKWVRIKGLPVLDEKGKSVSIRGVLQDIDDIKNKELELQKSLDILSNQNKRLQNFAHIVSHNLRSHTGNIKMLLHFFEKADDEQTRLEALKNIYRVSDQLDNTIYHLNEIVEQRVDLDKDLRTLHFESVLKQTMEVLEGSIRDQNVRIIYNFDQCPKVRFVTPYLESIFLNLLTNAIKYKHKDRDPEINIRSYFSESKGTAFLEISDNGSGIDLKRYGSKVFGMYKTFHKNVDARGLGLFITKNQVEAAGGTIDIKSTPGAGTTFIICFRKQD